MNRLTEQQQIDKRNKQMQQHLAANKVKDRLEKLGYTYTISLYAVILNPETEKPEYRRVEVFINGLPNQIIVAEIKQFFTEIKPYHYYSVWAYDVENHEIIMIGDWE
jgi:hypothetical protein